MILGYGRTRLLFLFLTLLSVIIFNAGCPGVQLPVGEGEGEDQIFPIIAFSVPNTAQVLSDEIVQIIVDYSDEGSGIDTNSFSLVVDGTDIFASCTVGPSSASCESPALAAGSHTLAAAISDNAGNQADTSLDIDLTLSLTTRITSLSTGTLTNEDSVEVTGMVSSAADSVSVNGVDVTLNNDTFSIELALEEGNNIITAIAQNVSGSVGSDTVCVVRDTFSPSVTIDTPTANQIVTTETITVTGSVYDVVVGTINQTNCRVELQGRAGRATAQVENGTFLVEDFPIVIGPNTITAVAIDTVGNESNPFTVDFVRQELVGQRLVAVSGNNQRGEAGQTLGNPILVRAIDAAGDPMPNRNLTFGVVRNTGSASGDGKSGTPITVKTDNNGEASIMWTLGSRSGAGNNRLEVTAAGFAAPLLFCASANPSDCSTILANGGENQTGVAGLTLGALFIVVAVDAGGNPCPGTSVTFEVQEGGGSFNGSSTIEVMTDASGMAGATLTLGPSPGVNNNVVFASAPGADEFGVTFAASASIPNFKITTLFSGVVLDTENRPIPNAEVMIDGAVPPIETFTDDEGTFRLTNVPSGSQLLDVDASTTTRFGTWPRLEFEINVVPGTENDLGMPIFIPQLDDLSSTFVSEFSEGTLFMAGVEGFELKVFADSATFPDGNTEGFLTVTQVSNDQVPMPPNGGAAPPWVGTLQPAGVVFDPPVQVTVPNSLGLPPGQIVDMFSFDHDLAEFIRIGTATVQADGATIVSDPGSGIRKSGWFFNSPPPPPPNCAPKCSQCQDLVIVDAENCVFRCDPKPNQTPCDDGNDCTFDDRCFEGACKGTPVIIPSRFDTSVNGPCISEIGKMVTFTAKSNSTDHDSEIQWRATGDPTPATGSGTSFTVSFATMGEKTVTATVCGSTSSKKITILEPCPADPKTFAYVKTTKVAVPCANCFGEVFPANPHFGEFEACIIGGKHGWRMVMYSSELGIGVQPLGRTNVETAMDAVVTAATANAIATDLTPNIMSDCGRPPRGTYWSQSRTQQHEDFHVTDFQDNFIKPRLDTFAMNVVVNNQTDCPEDRKAALMMQADVVYQQALTALVAGRQHECRAYGDGVATYTALANAIRMRFP